MFVYKTRTLYVNGTGLLERWKGMEDSLPSRCTSNMSHAPKRKKVNKKSITKRENLEGI